MIKKQTQILCHPELTRKSVEPAKRDFLFLLGGWLLFLARRSRAKENAWFPTGSGHRQGTRVIKRAAFTLAEVLITLTIIGIVAALTIPALTAHYKKRIIETRMEKFYSNMNQAVRLVSLDLGGDGSVAYIPNVTRPLNAEAMENWWNTYMAQYIKTDKTEKQNLGAIVAFPDGSGAALMASGTVESVSTPFQDATAGIHIVFCPQFRYCKDNNVLTSSNMLINTDGKNTFVFNLSTKGLVPYGYYRSRNDNKENCATGNKYNCSALIAKDGWKITEDYPIKF